MVSDFAWLQCYVFFPSLSSPFFQAERRFHESSQKLDLLQCSLTRLMGELSPEQAAVGIFKDYMTTPPSYADRKAVGLGKQQYTAITKPAALTGELYVSTESFSGFCVLSKQCKNKLTYKHELRMLTHVCV